MLRNWKPWLVCGLLLLNTGCLCRNQRRSAAPAPCPPGPPGGVLIPPAPRPVAVPPGPVVVPSGPAVVPPGPAVIPPPPAPIGGPPPGPGVVPPPDPLLGSSKFVPSVPPGYAPPGTAHGPAQVDYRWVPETGSKSPELKTPVPEIRSPGPSRVLLFPPEISEEPPLETSKSPPRKSSSLPVGIPGFAAPRDNVASGLRPSLDEGLDWLASNGYKTVLHLHATTESNDADKKQVEKRGMRYVSIAIDPANLGREQADEFVRLVKEGAGHPLFVYDRDGSLAGPLWYLYFRLGEELPEDAARVRAGALGLRETGPLWETVRMMAP